MATIRTAQDAADFLLALVRDDPRPYAARAADPQAGVRRLLTYLGDPQATLRVIHIAGSKGKGSVALLIEAILQAAGLRTGVFTSPHLERWNERFRTDGTIIDDSCFADLMEQVRPHVEALQQNDWATAPSFFDTATAAALLLFQQQQVDVAIVETGLGGRLDATNVVNPTVCCITSIELEHTDKLGKSLVQITAHKAGIIKPNRPVVIGALPKPALALVYEQALGAQAPLLRVGREFTYKVINTVATDSVIHYISHNLDFTLQSSLLGQHNALNIALAITCVDQLDIIADDTLIAAVRQGLYHLQLAGRCEVIQQNPWVVIDGAHTLASAAALGKVLNDIAAHKRYWVLSFAIGKSPKDIAQVWLQDGDEVIITQADPQRSQPPNRVLKSLAVLEQSLDISVIADPRQAVQQVYAGLNTNALLCITGSVYMAGIGRAVLAA